MRLFNYQIFDDKTEKNTLFPPSFMRNTLLSSLLFHLECDTCDSKKTTSLLEDARYAYAREPSAISFISISTSLRATYHSIWQVVIAKHRLFEGNLSLFCDFFPLWGNISPYTYRGAPMICASRFISTFTAKANPTYNTSCIVAFSLPDARTPPAIVAKVSTQNSPKKGLRQKEFFWHSPRVMQGKKLAERLTN